VKIVDFMVSDFKRAHQVVASHGWEWRTAPQQYKLPGGQGETLEGHLKGPDGVILGIIQLIGLARSQYVEIADDVLFSEMATSSFLVPDLEQAVSFYCDGLGLQVAEDVTIKQAELQRLIGLPPGVSLRMVLLGSGQTKSGKIGLLKYEGIAGNSLADRATPPNRGAVMITFETEAIAQLYERLKSAGGQCLSPLVRIALLTLKERMSQWTGVWEGTYRHLTPGGEVLDQYASRQETRLEGDRWYERITYRWPDGQEQTLDFRARFEGERLIFDDPHFHGESFVLDNIIVFPYYWKDRPHYRIVETIVFADHDRRSRLWQTLDNGELVKVTVIIERRIEGEAAVWY
jgi:catechol 2,3-dioxygenase-like lactoylglutathione lyase family enzyme